MKFSETANALFEGIHFLPVLSHYGRSDNPLLSSITRLKHDRSAANLILGHLPFSSFLLKKVLTSRAVGNEL